MAQVTGMPPPPCGVHLFGSRRFTWPFGPSRVGCRVDLMGLSRIPDGLAPCLPGGRRPESLDSSLGQFFQAWMPALRQPTSYGRAVDQPWGGSQDPDREDAQISTVI